MKVAGSGIYQYLHFHQFYPHLFEVAEKKLYNAHSTMESLFDVFGTDCEWKTKEGRSRNVLRGEEEEGTTEIIIMMRYPP